MTRWPSLMQNVIHISNRVDIPEPGKATAGGLDEAIAIPPPGVRVTRMGWSGRVIPNAQYDIAQAIRDQVVDGVRYITIDFNETMDRGYYSGTANKFLWPLFHGRADIAREGYSTQHNTIYLHVNEMLARMAKHYAKPDDVIVVHDYHLLPLGAMLNKYGVHNPTAFFLHIPLPSLRNIMHTDPSARSFVLSLIEDLTAYDQVGFQTQRDLNAFIMLRNLSHAHTIAPDQSTYHRATRFNVMPVIGNTQSYIKNAALWADRDETLAFNTEFGPAKIISVDRLDYSKGLPQKFNAVALAHEQKLLSPDQHFLQIAPFGREKVPAYRREAAATDEAARSLCEKFGPVATLYKDKVKRNVILGLFRHSRAGLVTPIKDGMNLVAMEYMAAQNPDNPGVLILSQQAGAAQILNDAALIVDAQDIQTTATALGVALHLPLDERQSRHRTALSAMNRLSNVKWQLGLINGAKHAALNRNMRYAVA